jgi:hypothetical protein
MVRESLDLEAQLAAAVWAACREGIQPTANFSHPPGSPRFRPATRCFSHVLRLMALNNVFRCHRIAIVGVGGSGSYILDQVAKTWVDRIDLFDGDVFENHNAFPIDCESCQMQ